MTRTELLCLVALSATVWCSLGTAEHDHDSYKEKVYHNHFAVVIPGSKETANEVASKYGFNNIGQVSTTNSPCVNVIVVCVCVRVCVCVCVCVCGAMQAGGRCGGPALRWPCGDATNVI